MTATATLVTTQAVELGRLGRPALLVRAPATGSLSLVRSRSGRSGSRSCPRDRSRLVPARSLAGLPRPGLPRPGLPRPRPPPRWDLVAARPVAPASAPRLAPAATRRPGPAGCDLRVPGAWSPTSSSLVSSAAAEARAARGSAVPAPSASWTSSATRMPGSASPITASKASSSNKSQRSCVNPVWPRSRLPPPAGRLKAWAQDPAGEGTGVSA